MIPLSIHACYHTLGSCKVNSKNHLITIIRDYIYFYINKHACDSHFTLYRLLYERCPQNTLGHLKRIAS